MLLTSRRLQEAYLLKEKFYDFVDSKNLYEAKKNLQAWYMFAVTCNLKKLIGVFKLLATGKSIF